MNTDIFWNILCNDLDFRFFSGVPVESLDFLFNSMKKDLLHYVPTVSDTTAVGIVGGMRLSGYKSAIISTDDTFYAAQLQIHKLIVASSIPILFITNSSYNPFSFKLFRYSNEEPSDILNAMDSYMLESNKPAVLLLEDI